MFSNAKTALIIHNANSMLTHGVSSRQRYRLGQAIELYKIALRRLSEDDSRVLTVHRQMAIAYWTCFSILQYPPDLEGALEHLVIVATSPATDRISHDDRFLFAQALAFNHSLSMQFRDLEEAIRQIRRAIDMLKPHETEVPAQVTALLCSLLRSHHSSTGVFTSLDESLLSLRALDNSAPGTAATLFSYAESYRCWCEWRNNSVDWDQCVSLYRQSAYALPERHEDRWWYTSHLASALCAQYLFNSGKTAHHDESVKLLIEALGQWQEVDTNLPAWRFNPQRRAFLAKLDLHLGFSYASEGQTDEYKALDMAPGTGYGYGRGVGDTKGLRISWVLSELGQALHVRYLQFRDKRDLNDALKLIQTAVYIRRKEGLGLARMLANLAAILMTRHEASLGDEEGLFVARAALLELHELPREDYGSTLLGPSLRGRLAIMMASGTATDDESLKEAMDLHVSALQQCPAAYYMRPTLLYTCSLLASQISIPAPPEPPLLLIEKALALTPPNSPLRLQMLIHCARIHWEHYRETGAKSEFTSAMSKFDEAIGLEGAGPDARLNLAMQWLASISMDKNSSATNPDEYKRLFEAQRSLLALLPNVASLGRDVQSRLDAAKAFQNLAQATAVKAPDVPSVVEVLEEGRSVFWGQALRLRLPPEIEKRTDPALKELAKALEGEWDKKVQKEAWELETNWHSRETMREIFDWKPTPIFQEERALHRREKLTRFNELVANARKIPGCERLMMPDSFQELKKAGDHGVIVILVASNSMCEAITIGSCSGEEKTFRLPLDTSLAALQDLCGTHREAYLTSRSADRSLREERRPIIKAGDPKALSKSKFYNVLKVLWLKVVSPVLVALRLKENTDAKDRPRLWWCPTGPFAFLPLHAAGTYNQFDPSAKVECCSDFVISSYTPSLGSLNTARHDFQAISAMVPCVQLIAEPAAPNQPRIPHTAAEVEAIKQLVPNQYLLQGPNGTERPSVEAVLNSLPSISILHLACHGHQDERAPLSSGFMLSDGRLKVSEIMKFNLKKAVFAFLSACESAAGDRGQPDESIHLGAALLFAGFRSIVGTLWSMDDADGPEVARVMYSEIFKDGGCNYEAIPYALDLAVRQLRSKGVHPSRWATYVHIGI